MSIIDDDLLDEIDEDENNNNEIDDNNDLNNNKEIKSQNVNTKNNENEINNIIIYNEEDYNEEGELIELVILENGNIFIEQLLKRIELFKKIKKLNKDMWTEKIEISYVKAINKMRQKLIDEIIEEGEEGENNDENE